MNRINILTVLITLALPVYICAQNPVPASPQKNSILLTGAIAHTPEGILESSVIGLKDGKIVLIGDMRVIRINRTEYDTIIDVTGKHVYPGLIAMNTTLGIHEISLVRATNDKNETGRYNASARSMIAYNTDSRVTPTVRSNGVMIAQVVPQGGVISGQSSVMELDGWNWEDAVYKQENGIHVRWPSQVLVRQGNAEKEKKALKKIESDLEELKKFFSDAKAYSANEDQIPMNLQFEATRGLFDGSKNVYIHCNHAKDIVNSVNYFSGMGMNMVIVGGHDSWMVTDLLRNHSVPVVIVKTHQLPMREDEEIFKPYKLAALLHEADVKFAISGSGFWQVRNLPFHAGTAVAYGLDKSAALASITSSPAEILGISTSVGSLVQGLDGTLIVTGGDILDMASSNVEMAFIRGKQIDLSSIQSKLYEKYMTKYGFSE